MTPPRISSDLNLYLGDGGGAGGGGGPFTLSQEDQSLLQQMRDRHTTLPVLILDAVLPGQKVDFGSHDDKFHQLCDYLLQSGKDLAMIGMNPHTGRPLSLGVTVSIDTRHEKGRMWTLSGTGEQRLEVQGEPYLDPTGSFYMADVELVTERFEPNLDRKEQEEAKSLSRKLPNMIDQWIRLMLEEGVVDASPKELEEHLDTLGRVPKEHTERAMWVARLLNPMPSWKSVSLEIRPAMLACKTDLQRIHLAHAALQGSIDHLSGVRKLF